jgi:hypothetical protein
MMRDVLIGTVTGIAAAVTMGLMTPRPQVQPAPVRELPEFTTGHSDLGLSLMPTTRPDPARAKLEKVIDKVVVEKARIEGVIHYIAEETGANVWVNWRALEAAGIDRDAPVTIDLRQVPARVALTQALDEVGGGTIKVIYHLVDGVVRISTADDLYRYAVTRIYDVRDLIERATAGGKVTDQEAMDGLVRLLQESIDPTVWREGSGAVSGIRAMNGLLIITHTVDNHARFAELIGGLRRVPRRAPK